MDEYLIKEINKFNPKKIFIVGNGSAGKSYLTKLLIDFYDLEVCNILNSDDYLLDKGVRKKLKISVYEKESYFIPALDRDIKMAIEKVPFTKLENFYGMERFKPASINIFEGIGMVFSKEFWNSGLKIFIYNDSETELYYRIKRDFNERNIPLEIIKNDFEKRRKIFDSSYIEYKSYCDIVVKNTKNGFILEELNNAD